MNSLHATTVTLIAAGLSLAGCSTTPDASLECPLVSLGAFGPVDTADSGRAPAFYLGAGDELGEAVFVQYVVSIRQQSEGEPVYATVTMDDLATY